jgi:hypothetical protein
MGVSFGEGPSSNVIAMARPAPGTEEYVSLFGAGVPACGADGAGVAAGASDMETG